VCEADKDQAYLDYRFERTTKLLNYKEMFIMEKNTSGVFAVEVQGEEIYVGASTQIEIAFRDYMGWIKKNKAPKAIQSHANDLVFEGMDIEDAIELFDYTVLIKCDDKSRLKELKKKYKELGMVEDYDNSAQVIDPQEQYPMTPEAVESTVKVEEPKATEMTIEERNAKILERISQNVSIKDIAEEFSVSKSTVYNVKNRR